MHTPIRRIVRSDRHERPYVAHATPWPLGSGGAIGGAPRASSASPAALDHGARLQLEDKIQQIIDGWTDEEKATAYWYLFASGTTVEKARTIRRRAGFVT
jgi:hypothetical protein